MGFSVLSVGSPSVEKDGFSLSANTSDWNLGRQTNIKIQRENKSCWQTDACNPHREVLGFFLHKHWLTDWQARWRWRQTESWHMHITHMNLHLCNCECTHTHTHTHDTTALYSCIPAIFFLEPKNGELHTWIFIHHVIEFSTNSKWHSHLSRLPVIFTHPLCYPGKMTMVFQTSSTFTWSDGRSIRMESKTYLSNSSDCDCSHRALNVLHG